MRSVTREEVERDKRRVLTRILVSILCFTVLMFILVASARAEIGGF